RPTVEGLAEAVKQGRAAEGGRIVTPLVRVEKRGELPLSFAQQRLWFLQQMQPASAAYNCPVMLRLSGELDQEVLARSFQGMVMRHEMLRTTFPSHDDRPVQKINLDMAPQIHVIDLEGLPYEEKETTAEQFAAEEARKPFDLAAGPLFRVQLLRLNPQEHVLLATMHHIITDAWSNEILIREFVELYAAQCQGRAPQLEEQSLQYADFAVWQRNWLEGEICEKQMDYWRKQLEDATTLEIPTDYPRPMNPTNAGAVLHFNISADRFVRLNELARRQGVTLFMILLAAFKVLLGRLTGQTDVATGTVIANRRNKDIESLIGFFVNQLVLRADLNGDPSFRVFLERIRKILLDAYDNQDVPFEKLAEELMPERMSARSPFFDVVFAMQNVQGEKIELPGLELRPFAAAELPTKWDLTLIVQKKEAGLTGSFYYATELFAEITARRFTERYDVLLESIVQDIERPISELNLLSRAERHQLEVEWNNSRRAFPDLTAADLFRIQVETKPLASAVVFGEKTLTYQELDKLTNQLGRYLRNLGVQAETRVGLYLERGIELITGTLGVLKAGGAYVPLDPAYPAERLAFMAEDAQLSVILTQNSLYSTFPNQWIQKVCLDQDWSQIASEESGALDSVTSPLNAAYVIYTSGSTGQPKGVSLSHQGLCNLALAQREIFHLSPDASVLQFSSFSFDAATWEMSMALLSGARFVLGSKEQILPGPGLLDLLKANSVTVATIPPSVLAALPEEQLPALETLVVAGEACSSELVKRWASGRCMLNAYGPTETTVCATISQPLNLTQLTPPIGRPIANMRVYVLDEHFAFAPIGAGGELCVAGTGLARGYLNRPELTAEKFAPNPYGDAGERLYRTGDHVRWRFDGQLEFLGRLDDQIKLRGFRIELGEIEAVLQQVAGVRQVVVLAADEDSGDKRLVAYVVPDRWAPKSLANGYLLANGRRISQENANETDLLFREIFERSAYAKHGISLHEESCVLDVGANIGIFMLWASEQAPRGRVYCFEPIAKVFEHLRRNSTLCDCAVKLFPIGLAEADMTTEFIYYPRCTAMSGLGKYADPQADLELVKRFIANQQQDSPEAGDFLREATGVLAPRFEGEECEVRVRRLSDVLREEKIEHVDLLKIDVERAELDVLFGIDAEDWEKIDQIVIEAHDEAGRASEGRVEIIRSLLRRAGYEVVIEEEANLRGIGLWNVYASRRGRSELRSAGDEQSQWARVQAKELDGAALKRHAQERLPDYMVPALYVELDEIPLTTNGKVDRKALLELRTRATGNTDGQAQRKLYSPVQEIIAGIWCEVLELNHVDCEANFFEIGGHSLLATQVISRIREAFGVALELHALFDNPQLHRLAEVIEEARQETASVSMPLIQRTDKSKDPPLSFAQQRLWFIDQMDPGNPAYNATFGVRLSGELNYNAVRQSLTGIVQRHEILRTSFQMIGNEPRQIIGQVEDMALRFIDLSGTDPEKWEVETRQLAHHEYNTRFDLTQGPLMRTVLVKLDKHEHLLLATMHHIVSDGWSLAIVVREFSRLYEGHLQGKSVQLEELAIQYADFAVWQREWLQDEVLKEQLEYWKAQLAGAPVLALPTDKLRPAVASHRGQSVTFELSQDLTEKLFTVARRASVTPFMLLLAAYQVLLCRYTEQGDIVVGTPIANRNRAEIEPLIGFFINQIALRSKIRRDESFSELLATVRAVSLDAYAHQDLPFEKLVEELSPERTLSHAPMFQVVFALQNAPYEEIHLSGLKLAAFAPEREFEKVDLSLVMEEREGVLKGELSYATDLFEKSTIEHFIGHFCCVLEDVAQDPSKSIQDLTLLTGAEREQLLESWNPLRVAHPAPSQCLHELFEAQAKRVPQTTAVMYEGEALTYAELNQKANQLARYLRSLGVERELRVGIFLERSSETIMAVLGTLKAGASYVPLDPGLPAERLAQMIEDVQVAVLITREKLRDKLPNVWAQVVSIDQDWETIAQEEASNLAVSISSDCLAYVIFTSGSTGNPKGVGIEHRQICRYTNAVTDCLQMQEGWSYGLISTFAADLGNTMLFPSLCVGGTLHVIAEDRSRDGNAMTQYVQEHGVLDCLKITPTQLRILVENGGSSIVPAKRLVVGGEASTWEWAREWQTIRPKCHIWNHYGPTESTVGVCTFNISGAMAESAPEHGNLLLGKPLQHSRLYVLDEAGELVPVGVPGELYIGGEGVGRGYLNSSSATAEKFVPDPFSGTGARLYRTGDRVRWVASGNLEFLGRKDKQIKLRGYRIELGEIENLLNEHADVRYAAVMVREDEPGQQLVAYVVPRWRDDHSTTQDASCYRLPNGLRIAQQNKNEYLHPKIPQLAPALATIATNNHEPVAASSSELKAYLAKKLPEHMVPADFVMMDELPLLANGKLDYKALPRPKERESLESYKKPRTPLEEILAEIWSDVLKVDHVGIEDNFFVLGGHSLLATQVISRAQVVLGTEIPLRMLFEEPTIVRFAACVESTIKQSSFPISPIPRVSRDLPLPLSFGQQRLWFLQQLDPNSNLYNLPYVLHLTGSLDQSSLRSAFSEIVRRHEILRTRYEMVGNEAVQRIDPAGAVPIEYIDLRHVAEPEAEALALAEKYAREAFDLSRGPLMRIRLLQLMERDYVLCLVLHHIVSDGWSIGVLVREFMALYEGYVTGREAELAELEVQYGDYAVWQREWLGGGELQEQMGYWKEQLVGLEGMELATDHGRPGVMSHRGATVEMEWGEELTRGIRGLCRREGVTLFMALLGGVEVVLGRYAGQEEVVVGTPIANRTRQEIEP
ncbi:MAG TPA: amino acid adenylation domain-containing protein, partial [Candidatus Angelobacter sp.]